MEGGHIESRPPASVTAWLPRRGAPDPGDTCTGSGPLASPGRITEPRLEPDTRRHTAPPSPGTPWRRCTHRHLRSRAPALQLARCVLRSHQKIAPPLPDSPVTERGSESLGRAAARGRLRHSARAPQAGRSPLGCDQGVAAVARSAECSLAARHAITPLRTAYRISSGALCRLSLFRMLLLCVSTV